ncbi:MAG: beta-galactosidase [Limnochordia bacterium]
MVAQKSGTDPLYWAWWGWEPLDHYRRLSGNAGAVDGRAPWLSEWYDRLHSKELVELMSDIGINLAVTHFFKGFGLRHEHDEQQRTKALVGLAHEHGIRVLGYCQSRSLYYESLLNEEPGAVDWVQRDQLGQPRTWGGAYYRWAPCIMNHDFRSYMKRVIRVGLEEIGLDGIHFDNCYAQPCYCDNCEKAFRDWLSERYPSPRERFGLASFDAVRQPPERRSPSSIVDPLIQAWVRFRCESLAGYLDDLSSYARSLRPDVIILGNPAYPRNPHAAHDISVWAPSVGKPLDLLFAENGQFPGMDEEVLISQVRAYKHAAAIGYGVVSTTWQRGRENRLGLPETAASIQLQIAEAAANGGVPGTNWALRPMGEGDRMRIDNPDWRQALKDYLGFVQANETRLQGARRVKDVAVLYSFASEAYDTRRATGIRLATEEALLRGGLSWEALFTDDLSELDAFSVLVLAGQSHLSESECAAIRAFAEQGKKLVMIGENGYRDESGLERAGDPFGDLPAGSVIRLPAQVAEAEIALDYTARIPLPRDWRLIVDAVAGAASGGLTVRLFGSTQVTVSAFELPSGDLAVHLVNYRAPRKAETLRLQVGRGSRAHFLTPEGFEATLQVKADGDERFIDVPAFAVYALITLS